MLYTYIYMYNVINGEYIELRRLCQEHVKIRMIQPRHFRFTSIITVPMPCLCEREER